VNVSEGGALMTSEAPMKPGARAELQLLGAERRVVRGRIQRCRITSLTPLSFEAAIEFDEPLCIARAERPTDVAAQAG
jgi:hypothetical protein